MIRKRIFSFFIVSLFYAGASSAAIHLELLGEVRLPTGLMFENTEVGGLSAISYVPEKNVYYALSDDRSRRQPARYYQLTIGGTHWDGADNPVEIEGVTFLLDSAGNTFKSGSVDPEGISVTKSGNFFVSSEGVAKSLISPFVALYAPDGKQLRQMSVPLSFMPSADGSRGVRDNFGFEALALSMSERLIITAPENALVQDGGMATLEQGSPSRLIVLDTRSGQLVAEYIYPVDSLPQSLTSKGGKFKANGLVELVALPWEEKEYFALERAYAKDGGKNIRLYHTIIEGRGGGTDMKRLSKELVLDFGDLNIPLDNIEGMTFGPLLADGRRSFVVISDNNFSKDQFTQILIFAISWL